MIHTILGPKCSWVAKVFGGLLVWPQTHARIHSSIQLGHRLRDFFMFTPRTLYFLLQIGMNLVNFFILLIFLIFNF